MNNFTGVSSFFGDTLLTPSPFTTPVTEEVSTSCTEMIIVSFYALLKKYDKTQ